MKAFPTAAEFKFPVLKQIFNAIPGLFNTKTQPAQLLDQQELKKIHHPCARNWGIEIIHVSPGDVTAKLTVRSDQANAYGSGSPEDPHLTFGPVITALAAAAMAAAAQTNQLDPNQGKAVTAELLQKFDEGVPIGSQLTVNARIIGDEEKRSPVKTAVALVKNSAGKIISRSTAKFAMVP